MKILAVETSCDETSVSVLEASGGFARPKFKVLSNVVISQVKIHAKWGGVVPNLAKREHAKNLIPILEKSLKQAKLFEKRKRPVAIPADRLKKLSAFFEREPELLKLFLDFIPTIKAPKIDAIAVTVGPGLEPALWVGVNFAKALNLVWGKPVVPVNHMEGHVVASLLATKPSAISRQPSAIKFPAIALLVSGGHTEIVLMSAEGRPASGWRYKIVGQTRDDAVGEAFDKVARILGLPYPGGPEIAALAAQNPKSEIRPVRRQGGNPKQAQNLKFKIALPRPMLNSGDFDFSFSGLKTAVLYLVNDLKKSKKMPSGIISRYDRPKESRFLSEAIVASICAEFQQAAIDVLVSKTIKAAEKYKAKTVILGGGVAANKELRKQLSSRISDVSSQTSLLLPDLKYTADNAAMIAAAAYFRALRGQPARPGGGFSKNPARMKANGNLSFK